MYVMNVGQVTIVLNPAIMYAMKTWSEGNVN